jgi:hypothetical protein
MSMGLLGGVFVGSSGTQVRPPGCLAAVGVIVTVAVPELHVQRPLLFSKLGFEQDHGAVSITDVLKDPGGEVFLDLGPLTVAVSAVTKVSVSDLAVGGQRTVSATMVILPPVVVGIAPNVVLVLLFPLSVQVPLHVCLLVTHPREPQ